MQQSLMKALEMIHTSMGNGTTETGVWTLSCAPAHRSLPPPRHSFPSNIHMVKKTGFSSGLNREFGH